MYLLNNEDNQNNQIQICKNTFFIHGHCELINPRKNLICYNSRQCISKEGFFECEKNRCVKKKKREICNQNNNCVSNKCISNQCL